VGDPASPGDLPTLASLDEVVALAAEGGEDLYVRWSKGPADDHDAQSRDDLTGVELPGLSASALAVEDWWAGNPLRLWVARRLHDYRHLRDRRAARAWVFRGTEVGRGPDNEPLVTCKEPVAWISASAIAEAERLVDSQSEEWGSLDRTG
jgi:hypothetical protein